MFHFTCIFLFGIQIHILVDASWTSTGVWKLHVSPNSMWSTHLWAGFAKGPQQQKSQKWWIYIFSLAKKMRTRQDRGAGAELGVVWTKPWRRGVSDQHCLRLTRKTGFFSCKSSSKKGYNSIRNISPLQILAWEKLWREDCGLWQHPAPSHAEQTAWRAFLLLPSDVMVDLVSGRAEKV